jgi:hypothetical protein
VCEFCTLRLLYFSVDLSPTDISEAKVRRFVSFGICLSALFIILHAGSAAHAASHRNASNWKQHDIAVYVVSTLNLLHTHNGQALTATLAQHLGVTHYDVYAD